MKHVGDITKLRGAELEPVDCITGGSPCQDLSVAGKRAGLAGARSGLFMEQIRIVKEMREHDRNFGKSGRFVRPRYMVWENVPGAFSSNKGKDFAAVLEEIVRIAEPEAPDVPVPNKGWSKSGLLYDVGGKWSVAWRLHDAQFWGVPQRRKRIALVADFGGLTAPEILYEPKGMSWDSEESEQAGKETARSVEGSIGSTVGIDVYNQEITGDVAASLTAACGGSNTSGPKALSFQERVGSPAVCYGRGAGVVNAIPVHDKATRCKGGGPTRNGDGAGNGLGIGAPGDPCPTLSTCDRHGVFAFDTTQITSPQNYSRPKYGDPCHPLATGAHSPAIVEAYHAVPGRLMANSHPGSYTGQDAYNDMLVAKALKAKANCDFREDSETYPITNTAVRRLTPLECERLQGYPDGWTLIGEPEEVEVKDYITIQVPGDDCPYESEAEAFDAWCDMADYDEDGDPITPFDLKNFGFVDKKIPSGSHKEIQYFYTDHNGKKKRCADSARYKALGNSIALPFWQWLIKRISAQYERDATLGSLFDGIGGFPYCWERVNGKGSARWASEIEEFPMAVTKVRFGDR